MISTMNWLRVARIDFAGSIRSPLLKAVTAVLTLLVGGATAVPAVVRDGAQPSFAVGLQALWIAAAPVVPIVGLVVGHRAIVGDRESGAIRLLLGSPTRRLDVIVGKAVGRFVVVTIATLVAFAAAAGVLAVGYDGFALEEFAVVGSSTALFAVVFVAVGVALSACVRSSSRAAGAAFGTYLTLAVLWEYVPAAAYRLFAGSALAGEPLPGWVAFLHLLTPGTALFEFTFAKLDALDGELVAVEGVAARVAGEPPFYLTEWVAAAIVLAWIVVPLAIGYARFRTAILD